jgi:ribosomal protein S18 acetylase RimI-like enzyme
MYVDSHFRGRGVATKLIETVLDHERRHGIERVIFYTADTQKDAIKLYERFRWIFEGQVTSIFAFPGDILELFSVLKFVLKLDKKA